MNIIDWLRVRHSEWKNLNSIVAIDSERLTGDTTAQEARYFISSSLTSASQILTAVRLHWSIENQLHWVLAGSVFRGRSKPYMQRQYPNQCCYYPSCGVEYDTTGPTVHQT
ncbi:MAG: hypothetical protein ACXV8Q_09120 [Methylobacter sp.]